MNNNDLFAYFQNIMTFTNPLDQICELKKLKKIYKTSQFYKNTKLNIFKAYGIACKMLTSNLIYKCNNLLNDDNLSEYINEVLNSIHLDLLVNNFLRSINYDQLYETIQNLIPDLDTTQMQELILQLKEATNRT